MKHILGILLVLFAVIAQAEETLPASCKPFTPKDDALILSAEKPLIVMIHNVSKSELWITHPVAEASASAGWTSRLQADHWSALALDKKNFELSCIESKPGHEQQLPCSAAISLCLWDAVTFPADNSGTFWAGEDLSLTKLISHLTSRGFGLPATAQ